MDSDTIKLPPLVAVEQASSDIPDEENLSRVPVVPKLGALKPRSQRNLKKLSLTIPTTTSVVGPMTASLVPPENNFTSHCKTPTSLHLPIRRASVVSLPPTSSAALYRKDEAESPSVPYRDGPIEVIPHVWIGDEENARDWKGLRERGIKSILNVAKELSCPLQHHPNPLRGAQSTSNIEASRSILPSSTYYPPYLPTGRPGFHYLKLPWSHGQSDLVKQGFPAAMQFVDDALSRGDGILVHCQCGVSRSATLIIALVMRAAACAGPTTSPDIAVLKGGGMHAAYAFVKEKSKWVGPNMSLIYQLLDYERTLQSGSTSPSSSINSNGTTNDEYEWNRQGQALEERMDEEGFSETSVCVHEAKALDIEMEERKIARKTSQQSVTSTSSGVGVALGWRSRYGFPALGRSRAGSIGSTLTAQSSALGEDILEEGEEDVRFSTGASPSTLATDEESYEWSKGVVDPEQTDVFGVPTPKAPVPMSAILTHKTSFKPLSRPRMKSKLKHRPPPLVNLLPPVPSSPLPASIPIHDSIVDSTSRSESPIYSITSSFHSHNSGNRRQSCSSTSSRSSVRSSASAWSSSLRTPSQTLLVFPSEARDGTSTVMLTATPSANTFPASRLPNLASCKKPCLNMGVVSTPTTAFSLVEVKGTSITVPPFKRKS